MKSIKIPALFAVCSMLFGLDTVGQCAEHDHIRHLATASRSWLPGAMVEVVVVEPVIGEDVDGRTQMIDLVVDIRQVFTGPKSLHGARLRINPSMAFRFPPDRWSALYMSGIQGESIEGFPAGKRGLLWIFQRRELPTGRTGSNGNEFLFFTGFQPVWERSNPGDSNEDFYRQERDQTLQMMHILGEIEALDASRMEQTVLDLVGHENDRVRRWALAALARVKGVGAIALLKSLEPRPDGTAVIEDFIDQMLVYRPRNSSSESEMRSMPRISLLGVEIVTQEKREGQPTLSRPQIEIEPGTVRILRVFAGSGFREGEIVEADGAIDKPGTKLLVAPKDGRIRLPHPIDRTSFPPQGPWDGGMKRLRYALEPDIDLTPLEPWLERLSGPDTLPADDFLEDALRNAPPLVAMWALRNFLDHLRPETLDWLRDSSGLDEAGSAPTSMREMVLYEQAMHYLYGKLWLWSAERIDLFEQIFSYPLSDREDAWLLNILHHDGFQPLSASVEEWKRLSLSVRQNNSWRGIELDPLRRRELDALAWNTVQTEALATLDATTSVDYLIERWGIADRGEHTAPFFVESWGSSLAHALPLNSKEVERLRTALKQRLTTTSDPVPPEEIEKRIQEIRAMTWDEILALPFP